MVTESDQGLREVCYVSLHPTGNVEGVRADQTDPHERAWTAAWLGRQISQPQRLQHVPILRPAAMPALESRCDSLGPVTNPLREPGAGQVDGGET